MKKKFVVKGGKGSFVWLFGCDTKGRANPYLWEFCYRQWKKFTEISIKPGQKKIIEIEFREIGDRDEN